MPTFLASPDADPKQPRGSSLLTGRGRVRYYAVVGLLGLLVGAEPNPQAPPYAAAPTVPPAPVSPPPSSPPAAPGTVSAMDQPLRLLADARQTYQGTKDYTCLFVKRERIRGQLQP